MICWTKDTFKGNTCEFQLTIRCQDLQIYTNIISNVYKYLQSMRIPVAATSRLASLVRRLSKCCLPRGGHRLQLLWQPWSHRSHRSRLRPPPNSSHVVFSSNKLPMAHAFNVFSNQRGPSFQEGQVAVSGLWVMRVGCCSNVLHKLFCQLSPNTIHYSCFGFSA